ncbi:MAG: heavy metal translocating P-type ATPase [Lachnospiraceae bacterium]|nr:heavy metal translocating P-type ATPase [Lachnospiraceae bacterium]
MNRKQKNLLIRIIAAIVCVAALLLFDGRIPAWYIKLALYMIPYLIVGYDIIRKAWHGIRNGQIFDENFLMTVATIGAIGVGIYNAVNGGEDDYLEAVAVMLLYQVGELFQSYAVGKSRRNISDLMDIRPDYANIEEDGQLVRVDPDEVEVGSVIVVQPGEKIPLDGIVVEGKSSLNTAALTGESVPRNVSEGSEVLSGCINESGVLKVRTTTEFDESTASRILDLVENAASRKSKSENFISRFAKYYTPIVCFSALALAVLPPIVLRVMGRDPMIAEWVYRACTFLVISCPCAVVISVPLSFFAGLGGASSSGILIKGSNFLEAMSSVRCVVFDKTGTITRGNFEVTAVHRSPIDSEKLLEYAALIESHSSHPISLSLQKAYGKFVDQGRVTDVQEISGHGVTGRVDGVMTAAGNTKLMESLGIPYGDCEECETDHQAGTVVHMAVDGVYAGHIVIADELKPTAEQAMRALKEAGVTRTVMLTGDTQKVAEAVAAKVGLEEFHAGLLPADKVVWVEKLLEEKDKKTKLAFVGDGINDAPVLSRADIGIAMGAMGSDAAIEAADVVLMDDDPMKIAKAIRISRKCIGIVHQNIVFALGVKILCLILGAVGIANMWVAIISDVGVMILAVLNAVRALFVKKL